MTCREFIEFLWRYLEAELSESQRATFDAHLSECPACVNYLDAYRKTAHLTREAFHPSDQSLPAEVPEDLVRAILAARSK